MTENYFDISDTFSISREASTPVINFEQLAIETQFYPNPVQNEATLIIRNAGNHLVQVMVNNVHGQMVDRLFSENTPNGDHHYRWKTDHFPSGIYQISVQLRGITRSFPILVTR
ncbi:MAG: T9SS type A sorting domain-containing protein [Saprospiraceae bacterium]|nr:T9SS type A sorting domain-containing protein [Saprospiraceae bacterium]